ncbi:MAG: hypothetical protein IJ177_07170 [Fibrobacter sp.]|uniref:hypothetical protein n=1 Tax=Fibrobacter sp. TaxID=35828 RepID=UPI0025BAA2B2|nr:hypothetical protein [Fibrobacter sp.]MBQ9225955.1 hypothetical protein [Fibrobacter sp.]
MKRFLTTAAVSAMLLTACGDDTSSNAGNGSSRPTGDDVFSRAGTLYVNESEHILAIALENYETQMCVVEEDNYTWKTVHINNEPDSMMYEFRGDTLLLYDIYHGLPDTDYGEMLVGGTAGSLYGTWTYTGCEYDKEEDETECHEKNLQYFLRTITFSKGKAEINYKVYFDRYVEDHSDFMNSYFMSQLFNTLGGNYPEIYLDEIWYMEASSVQATAQKIGAVFTSKTKSNATFELGGKTYTVNVKHMDMSLNREGYFIASENKEIQVEVSDGITTCTGEYISHYMNADYCKAEYKDNLRMDEWEDSNLGTFIAAERYRSNNEDDFEQCITGIAYKKYDPLDGYTYSKALTKKGGSASDREFRRERSLRKWAKYAQ